MDLDRINWEKKIVADIIEKKGFRLDIPKEVMHKELTGEELLAQIPVKKGGIKGLREIRKEISYGLCCSTYCREFW